LYSSSASWKVSSHDSQGEGMMDKAISQGGSEYKSVFFDEVSKFVLYLAQKGNVGAQ